MNKQGSRSETRKVCRPELCRLARGMQRVRQPEKARSQLGLLGSQHGGLAATVRVPTKKDALKGWIRGFQSHHRPLQPFAVVSCARRRRRTMRPLLPKRQIATKDAEACIGEGPGRGRQQGG